MLVNNPTGSSILGEVMGYGQYILDGHKPVLCTDMLLWAQQLSSSDARRVALDTKGDISVSTVFLGIDHSHSDGDEHPILFETMISNGDNSQEYCMRYETWDEAVEGHAAACVIAFGEDDEVVKAKAEWKQNLVFDKMVEKIMDDE